MPETDPITLEIIDSRLDEVVGEMQEILYHTGYSTIIRESKDASAAITSASGEVIGQAIRLPLHAGVFTPSVEAITRYFPLSEIHEEDAFLMNDPYIGGSNHSPDFIVATPVFCEGELLAFCLSIAHKPDIGGLVPGSCGADAREIYHEGIQLPPVRYCSRGEINKDLENILVNNSRIPHWLLGDLRAQWGSTRIGCRKLQELIGEYGVENFKAATAAIIGSTERRVRQVLASWKDGVSEAEGFLDDDGAGGSDPVRLHVRVTKTGERIEFDFTGCGPQTTGPINVQPHLVRGICSVALVGMMDSSLPFNSGLVRLCEFKLKPGTVVHPIRPAPCNHYSGTLCSLLNVILRAVSAFCPERAVADCAGMIAITVGGEQKGGKREPPHYEIIAGAFGANGEADGASGIVWYGSNVEITPIEIIESEFPSRIERFGLYRDSAGAGEHRGGVGFIREYTVLKDTRLTYRGSCHRFSAQGVFGGKAGVLSECIVNPGTPEERKMPTIGTMRLKAGDRFRILRPGGGGVGDPLKRDPHRVLGDVLDGVVSVEKAREDYGVVIDLKSNRIDEDATQRLRATGEG